MKFWITTVIVFVATLLGISQYVKGGGGTTVASSPSIAHAKQQTPLESFQQAHKDDGKTPGKKKKVTTTVVPAPYVPNGWTNAGISVVNPNYQAGTPKEKKELVKQNTPRQWWRLTNPDPTKSDPVTLTRKGKFEMMVEYPIVVNLTLVLCDKNGKYLQKKVLCQTVDGPFTDLKTGEEITLEEMEKNRDNTRNMSFESAHGAPIINVEVGFVPEASQGPIPPTLKEEVEETPPVVEDTCEEEDFLPPLEIPNTII